MKNLISLLTHPIMNQTNQNIHTVISNRTNNVPTDDVKLHARVLYARAKFLYAHAQQIELFGAVCTVKSTTRFSYDETFNQSNGYTELPTALLSSFQQTLLCFHWWVVAEGRGSGGTSSSYRVVSSPSIHHSPISSYRSTRTCYQQGSGTKQIFAEKKKQK